MRNDRDEERRRFHADADYEAWRRGAPDPDYDRVDDAYYAGGRPEDPIRDDLDRQRETRERRERERHDEEQQQEAARQAWEEQARDEAEWEEYARRQQETE